MFSSTRYRQSSKEGDQLNPETFRKLCEVDWGAIGVELLAFAASRAKIYRWYSGQGKELAPGVSIEDVVHLVIEKTISGKRNWDPAKGPLVPWLKDQVKSVLDAMANSASNRYETPEREGRNEENTPKGYDLPRPPNPEKAALMADRVNELFQAVGGDKELEEVLEAVMHGCEATPRHLAAELGVPKEDINNRLKRLRRRAIKEDI